mmetsp:Transcript_1763/g.3335  ORF Transcript_1763/g.3335 Transcript_1763/m.3335 type:complete len:351 (-) Transcript_1763:90-1142(-)
MLQGMVSYYRSNYETALRQIKILRRQVYQYELQLGLAPENTTKQAPKPSYEFPTQLFPGRWFESYGWEQDMEEVRIFVKIAEGTTKGDVEVRLRGTSDLHIAVTGETYDLGRLSHDVDASYVYWIFNTNEHQEKTSEGEKLLQINLMKRKRYENWKSCFESELNTKSSLQLTPTATAYLDVDIEDGSASHRLEIGLFGDDVPRTCANFMALCRGEESLLVNGSPRKLSYKNTEFHALYPGILLKGGDVLGQNGTGSHSIYGPVFADESLAIKHTAVYTVGMANDGSDSNGSQFYITLCENLAHLDDQHVVFGRVTRDVDKVLPLLSRSYGSPSGHIRNKVTIVDCGVLED